MSLLSSRAIIKPVSVTRIAVIFRYQGMVMIGAVVGGMLSEIR